MTKSIRQGIFFLEKIKQWRMIRLAGKKQIAMPLAESIGHTLPALSERKVFGQGEVKAKTNRQIAGKGKDEKRKVFL